MAPSGWTLDELNDEVQRALEASDYVPASSARVRAVPDQRTIRYYTTLGLVDRPELRGRVATYGRRHLMQLVAIKRLQAQGLTLAQIQQRLAGAPEGRLTELAALPDPGAAPARPPEGARRDAFWSALPADLQVEAPSAADLEPYTPAQGPAVPLPFTGVPLAAGVSLLLEGRTSLTVEDVAALRAAAAPLIAVLKTRGITA